MRKHVKPAHRQAAIPDHVRGGDLPPNGLVVEWSVHWARLAQRGDVVVSEIDEDQADAKGEKRPTTRAKAKRPPRAASPRRRPEAEPKAPVPAPAGDAPGESGPQVETIDAAPPASTETSEPSLT